jgi:hypothetical protein
MSNLKVNTINDASGGSNAVLYGVAAPANSMGFRNRIINGDMRIDQRNAGASVTPILGTFIVDRWAFIATQTSKATAQQNAGAVTPPASFSNYLGVTSSSSYSVLTGDTFGVYQNIEGFNVADLGWGTANAQAVIIGFWVRSSLTGTFGGAVANSAENRSYVFSYTISAANTWEFKTVTVSGDTSGTWVANNGVGLRLRFGLGSGSTYTAASGSWGAGNFVQPTGSVSVVGTNGATFYITGVQLEAGSVASPFERRDYGRELIMCQRYYESGYIGVRGATSAAILTVMPYAVVKRATPTVAITVISGTGVTAGNGTNATTQSFYITGTSGGTGFLEANWNAPSEL